MKFQYASIKRNNENGFSGHWGFIVAQDERYYWIGGGAFGTNTVMPFSRDEFTIPRTVPNYVKDSCERETPKLEQLAKQTK